MSFKIKKRILELIQEARNDSTEIPRILTDIEQLCKPNFQHLWNEFLNTKFAPTHDICPICQEQVLPEQKYVEFPCCHKRMHQQLCAEGYTNQKCPCCRQPFVQLGS